MATTHTVSKNLIVTSNQLLVELRITKIKKGWIGLGTIFF
jgi:hypothetical protein